MSQSRRRSVLNPTTHSRRAFLTATGAAGLLLGSDGPHQPESRGDAPKKDTIKVGILHSLTGFLALNETILRDAELLAVEEINKAGGLLGKQIVPVVEDTESKFSTVLPEKAKKLLEEDKVAALFGCWVSVGRKNVLSTVEKGNGLLFFPNPYEGNEQSPNIVYTGSVPNQLAMPAVDWLLSKAGGGRKKLYLIGSDFIYPRMLDHVLTRHLKAAKTTLAGRSFVPIGQQDFGTAVADIKKSGADAVLSTIVGDSNVAFFAELRAKGFTAKDLPVCSLLLDADELRHMDAKLCQGHLAARAYFQSIDTEKNRAFVKRFQAKYGKESVVGDTMESAYSAVHLWKSAVEKAKSTDVDKVRKALPGLTFDAPCGKIEVAKNQHTWKPFRIGKIAKGGQVEILYTSAKTIEPDPYKHVKS